MKLGETMPSAGQGQPEKIDPKKTVYRSPEGRLSNMPVPGIYKQRDVKESTPEISVASLMHERAKQLLQESEAARLSLQRGAAQEVIAQTRFGNETTEDVMARVEELRAGRMRRMESVERSAQSIRQGLDAVAVGVRPTVDFLRELDHAEENAARELDSLWEYRDMNPRVYAETQAKLRALAQFKERIRNLPERPA
ncbi:MAG TPA: hypothetical protein VN397_04830 [Candidatus Methylomirabilis sp.]|nr:hypothetical protein [Candidatus Methylomirabilis sp.]